ncbi:YybH family protein [Candidatus Methylopumilus turicensis]|uniref:Cds6 C-terminal domain-containing protein n=1 Tax=Candidatus Methylopumilus turicensis TaxID=1581680 RepID=A0A0B7J000_9PROT|nr:nuclear transport factor 2 family protein [Candidatus Methylopumilus turicensis]CEN56645.1 exported protein of unknown function [Candidatus Methylopumilus turicensis]
MQKRLINTANAGMLILGGLLAGCSTVKDLTNVDLAGMKVWPFGNNDVPRVYQPANSVPYLCEGNKKFFVRMLDNGASAWLILPEREVLLAQSGASKVYTNGISKLDLSSDDVSLVINETTKYVGCKANSAAKVSKVTPSPSAAVAKKEATPKAEAKEAAEKSWLGKLKFWESDPQPQAAPTAPVVNVVEPVKVAEPAPVPAPVKEAVPVVPEAVVVQDVAPPTLPEKELVAKEDVQQEVAQADTKQTDQAAVLSTLDAWASAWRSKNTDAYLSFYSANFKPEGMSQKAWIAQRKQRLGSNPAEISLVLENVKVGADANKAEVSFVQRYTSGKVSDTVVKVLRFENENGHWFIVKETSQAKK